MLFPIHIAALSCEISLSNNLKSSSILQNSWTSIKKVTENNFDVTLSWCLTDWLFSSIIVFIPYLQLPNTSNNKSLFFSDSFLFLSYFASAFLFLKIIFLIFESQPFFQTQQGIWKELHGDAFHIVLFDPNNPCDLLAWNLCFWRRHNSSQKHNF